MVQAHRASIRTAAASALLAAAVGVAACSPGGAPPGDVPPSPSSVTSTPGTLSGAGIERFFTQTVVWKPCPTEVAGAGGSRMIECGTAAAPLDYTKPDGRQVVLMLIRLRAPGTGRNDRIGTLLVNPGGPGASGVEYVAQQAEQLAKGVGDRFDIVGFDPRGVGRSTPAIRCLTDQERDSLRASDLRTDHTEQGVVRQENQAKEFAAKCAQRTGVDVLAHVGTADTVDDMDLLRRLVGDEKLNYLGYSYGTFLGARYAQKYPERVRTMILDGAVNPAEDTATMTVNQYAGLQQAFNTYAADCATRRAADCPLGTDPSAATTTSQYQQIVRALIGRPVAVGNRALTYGDAIDGTVQAMYSPSLWPYLTIALQDLRIKGSGRIMLQLADSYNNRGADGTYTNGTDALASITCMDTDAVKSQDRASELAEQVRAAAPFADDGRASRRSARDTCAFWPIPPTTAPAAIEPGPDLPATVTVSTTGDPATPYANGLALADQLRGSVLTVQGTQHTGAFAGVDCVDQPLRTYLERSAPPSTGLTCVLQ